jgi:hypothetical protein
MGHIFTTRLQRVNWITKCRYNNPWESCATYDKANLYRIICKDNDMTNTHLKTGSEPLCAAYTEKSNITVPTMHMLLAFMRPWDQIFTGVPVTHLIFFIISGSTVLVRTLAASHQRFRNLIKTFGKTPLDEWSARRKGLYLHRTTQHRNTKTNIHASSGIRTHGPSNQAAKPYALETGLATMSPNSPHHVKTKKLGCSIEN